MDEKMVKLIRSMRKHCYDTGIYFGYPKCCIEAFCYHQKGKPTDQQVEASQLKGFIPCPKHTEEILQGKTTLESLIQNRKHYFPFPNGSKRIK